MSGPLVGSKAFGLCPAVFSCSLFADLSVESSCGLPLSITTSPPKALETKSSEKRLTGLFFTTGRDFDATLEDFIDRNVFRGAGLLIGT